MEEPEKHGPRWGGQQPNCQSPPTDQSPLMHVAASTNQLIESNMKEKEKETALSIATATKPRHACQGVRRWSTASDD